MFGSFPPSPLVGLRLQSLLGLGADIVMGSLHSEFAGRFCERYGVGVERIQFPP
jgi:hypothetical protein